MSVIHEGKGSIRITIIIPEIAGITRIVTTGVAGTESFIPDTGVIFVDNFIYEDLEHQHQFEFYCRRHFAHAQG